MLVLTFLCREHFNHTAERPLSHAVVDSHCHLKLGQGRNAVISVNISGCIRRCQHCLDPGAAAKWAESHDITKVLPALLFLWNWLRQGQKKVTPLTQTSVSRNKMREQRQCFMCNITLAFCFEPHPENVKVVTPCLIYTYKICTGSVSSF